MKPGFLYSLFSSDETAPTHRELILLGREWGWLLAAGILFVLLGIMAFSMPIMSSVGLTFALALLLVATGAVHLVQAVRLRHRHGSMNRFARAVLALVTGGVMLRFPGGGMLGVALALSFYFLVSATMQWILFFGVRSLNGSGWILFSSIVSFLLGVYMIFTFPFSALWIPGLLLGMDLTFAGMSMIGWAVSIRRLHRLQGRETPKSSLRGPGTLQPSMP